MRARNPKTASRNDPLHVGVLFDSCARESRNGKRPFAVFRSRVSFSRPRNRTRSWSDSQTRAEFHAHLADSPVNFADLSRSVWAFVNRNKLRAPPHADHSSTRSRTSKMASMAMPVMGATAVASRVSVRAKSNFHGARVAGVRRIAPRPAAVQARASARAVEQADDLQLGQVRPATA